MPSISIFSEQNNTAFSLALKKNAIVCAAAVLLPAMRTLPENFEKLPAQTQLALKNRQNTAAMYSIAYEQHHELFNLSPAMVAIVSSIAESTRAKYGSGAGGVSFNYNYLYKQLMEAKKVSILEMKLSVGQNRIWDF